MKLFYIFIILQFYSINDDLLYGKWKMYRNETMESILTSKRFQLEDEQTQQALAETFSKVLNGSFYHFKKDSVVFTDFKNDEIIELKGMWWTEGDTLIIGQLEKVSVQKYLITRLDESELHFKLINPRDGIPFRRAKMFKKED
ncbi:hypothetical protein ACFSKL_16875 [Belliella marina]|uniref:Lipocalin-like domain-containing protein n=1 Tax=Belliella marina TaxID=1644146 RepID=A0ABW4VNX0_9BACT